MRGADRWVEISIKADKEAVDDLCTLLSRHCLGGIAVEDPLADQACPDDRVTIKGFLPVQEEETRRKLEVALLLLSRGAQISEPQVRVLEPEDWAESWKAYFEPQHIGIHTVVVPSWREYAPQVGDVVVEIDPGMAFGTGLHPSTRLCLAALEEAIQPGMSVLDLGTGSGILAIAAAKWGAGSVLALDVDPIAVEVARENVALNGVEGVVSVAQGSLSQDGLVGSGRVKGPFDLLLVNILAEVISSLAPLLASALGPGGTLIASGILDIKAEEVSHALEDSGIRVTDRRIEDEWVALIGHRSSP